MLTALIVIIAIILLVLILIEISERLSKAKEKRIDEQLKAEAERSRLRSEQVAKEKAAKEEADNKYAVAYNALVEKYGECSFYTMLRFRRDDINSYLYVFEKAKCVVLFGEHIPFKKILGFNLIDDDQEVQTNTSFVGTSTTKTSNMAGRALAGGVLFGVAGAIAGAATAERETSFAPTERQSIKETRHKYRLYVNLDDFTEPLREIKLGEDPEYAYKVTNVFNIIVQRNQAE